MTERTGVLARRRRGRSTRWSFQYVYVLRLSYWYSYQRRQSIAIALRVYARSFFGEPPRTFTRRRPGTRARLSLAWSLGRELGGRGADADHAARELASLGDFVGGGLVAVGFEREVGERHLHHLRPVEERARRGGGRAEGERVHFRLEMDDVAAKVGEDAPAARGGGPPRGGRWDV